MIAESNNKKTRLLEQEEHPWRFYIPENCRVLVIGTFPPTTKNWSFPFFYPNKRNRFWNIMEALAASPLSSYEGELAVVERKKLLDQLKVGVTDMGAIVLRADNSSLDEKLTQHTFTDIIHLLETHPSIERLLFTSSSGSVSAWGWFKQYLTAKGIPHRFVLGKKPCVMECVLAGRTIALVVAYSTSPRASNRVSFDAMVDMYRVALDINLS